MALQRAKVLETFDRKVQNDPVRPQFWSASFVPLADAQALALALVGVRCTASSIGCMSPDVPSSRFEDWQLADELASCAERCVCDAFSASVDGRGPGPTAVQLDVCRALRLAARRLLSAALRDLPSN